MLDCYLKGSLGVFQTHILNFLSNKIVRIQQLISSTICIAFLCHSRLVFHMFLSNFLLTILKYSEQATQNIAVQSLGNRKQFKFIFTSCLIISWISPSSYLIVKRICQPYKTRPTSKDQKQTFVTVGSPKAYKYLEEWAEWVTIRHLRGSQDSLQPKIYWYRSFTLGDFTIKTPYWNKESVSNWTLSINKLRCIMMDNHT